MKEKEGDAGGKEVRGRGGKEGGRMDGGKREWVI